MKCRDKNCYEISYIAHYDHKFAVIVINTVSATEIFYANTIQLTLLRRYIWGVE